MDWYVRLALDEYRERIEKAQGNYDFHRALYADRGGRSTSSRILTLTGGVVVSLGKRLQRWGGAQAGTPQATTRWQTERAAGMELVAVPSSSDHAWAVLDYDKLDRIPC
jgi:hypothetical protein